jgi:Ser/Thr protein kinase RdoA (MazF antagonist)
VEGHRSGGWPGYAPEVELLAEGRTAEVFAYGEGRVLKLDRPGWTGLAPFEGDVLTRLAEAGLPVARPHGVVTVEGRSGIVLDRVDGVTLREDLLASPVAGAEALAVHFVELQLRLNATIVPGLPPLVPRLRNEIASNVADEALRRELLTLLDGLDDGELGVCHYDLSPDNVLVGPDGWVVIDWITAAAGPSVADLARTLVMWGRATAEPAATFLRAVRRIGGARRQLGDEVLDHWVRVVAAGRLGEGFEGEEAAWLRQVAAGGVRLFA